MKRHLFSMVGPCLAALVASTIPGQAENKAAPKDRAALAACLGAARVAKRSAETCIGTVQDVCATEPGNESNAAMSGCVGREIAIWDERLNAAYKAALAGDLVSREVYRGARKLTGAELLRDAQRAWIAFRARKCSAARLPMEGGSGAALLGGACFLQETARQTIWLESLEEEA